jgi:hypothetical protein
VCEDGAFVYQGFFADFSIDSAELSVNILPNSGQTNTAPPDEDADE